MHAKSVKCPVCKAEPGKVCKGPGSSGGPHKERIEAASTKRTAAILPLKGGPLKMSEYIERTKDISIGDLQEALDAKLLHAAYPPAGPELIVFLLPNGNELLKRG